MTEDPQALALNWVFGTATGVVGNIANLSDGYNERVCFVAAHTAVVYDKRLQRQTFLQGHCNSISCMAVTEDRSTIITADVGSESMLVLWNSRNGVPLQSISQPHKLGIIAMDISPDDEWLATVGAVDPKSGEQEVGVMELDGGDKEELCVKIALWSLATVRSNPKARPCVLTVIPAGDVQHSVRFNMNDMRELISNGKRRVYFWSHQYPSTHRFKYYSPPLRAKDFKQSIGDFVSSVFAPGSTQALTATSDGDLVVWDEQGITAQMGTRATDRRAIKLMRIHNSSITYLSTIGDYIVSGGDDGYIRFYDPLLRIVAWFEDLDAGPIAGIAFSAAPPSKLAGTELADTINRFMAPDFVVSTRESRLVSVQSSSFEEFDVSRRKGQVVLDALMTGIVDVATHPTKAEFAVLSSNGTLQRWDLVTHSCIISRTFTFNKMVGTKVCYSRDGSFIVAGFDTGFIHIVSTDTLQDLHVGRNTSSSVTMLACSTTGDQVALADGADHVLMYAVFPYKHTTRWEYVGKSQAHHGKVVGLIFGESPTGQTRLFSMGADSRIVEYDLAGSTPATGLKLAMHQDLPPNDVPTAVSFAPPLKYYRHHSADTVLLTCNSQYKVCMYNPDSQAQVATFVGPTFAGPIKRLIMFNSATEEAAFLAYATSERVVGLMAWPMDGDPAKTMGLIAHPGAISAMSISYDGRKLLTAGADGTLNVWDIRASALSSAAAAAAKDPQRWEHVVDNPDLVAEIREYFLYAQIKAQGEASMAPRAMSGKVPVSMLPDLMRAAGYYPSQAEVANMINHLNFVARSRDLDTIEEIGFEDLLCLFHNHRPMQEVSQEDISRAFLALGANPNTGRLGREQLLTMLQQLGEPIDAQELLGIMKQLTGCEKLSQAMPHMVDAPRFATDVLGFEEEKAAEMPAQEPAQAAVS